MSEWNSIKDMHHLYLNGTSVESVIQSCYQKIDSGKRNTFITQCRDRALEKAKKLQKDLDKSKSNVLKSKPLFGVPVGIKDALNIAGVRTTCASKILGDYTPPFTATCVSKLEDAGAIVIGKTNMDEFAMGSSNENSAFGNVIHPTHPDRVPGGSSGGSAASVAAKECLVALGSDTGGSIRLPASFCGVVGFKPTYGRVSRYGLVAFASSLDQVGPLALSVRDAATVCQAMMGVDENDMTTASREVPDLLNNRINFSGLKVGVPKEYFEDGLDSSVEKSVRAALKWFESQGAKLIDVEIPHSKYSIATYYIVANCEASSNLSRYDGVRFGSRPKEASRENLESFYCTVRSQFGTEVKRRVLLGTFALSSGYYDAYYKRACQVRRLIKDDFDKVFSEVDLMIGPVAPNVAFKVGERTADPMKMYLADIFTVPVSLAGLPSVSLPCGKDSDGLSIGLQIVGPAFEDARVLQYAQAFETFHKGGQSE